MGYIIDNPRLREQRYVFSDRHEAGKQLGQFLKTLPKISDAVVLAIPAGGVPVGKEVALLLGVPIILTIVRKIQVPGNTEAGFGAVTWDGGVLINEPFRTSLGLSQAAVDEAIRATKKNVRSRIARFTGRERFPDLAGKTAILVDDGIASGFTMLALVKSVRSRNPARILVAVPTASASSIERIAKDADQVVCLNIRSTHWFAVADAYVHWHDLDDEEVLAELADIRHDQAGR